MNIKVVIFDGEKVKCYRENTTYRAVLDEFEKKDVLILSMECYD